MSDANPPTADPKTPVVRDWTVLIYMAGDNNLSEECVFALTEIKQGLRNYPGLSVIAQFDPSGVRAETKRYELRAHTTLDEDFEKTGWKVRETDTGEPHNLLDFIRWGISEFPARKFMVVLAGHGDGTESDFLLRDENPPNSLSIPELQDVFKQLTDDGHKINILGMDTCLMNMTEVCFELNRTSVTYLVGSEGFAPNTGWPYAEIFRQLADKIQLDPVKGADPKWLAETIVLEYTKFYVPYINGGISVDQSALEVAKINEVKDEVSELVKSLLDEIQKKQLEYGKEKQRALIFAHWEAQSYNGEVFVDLSDFCQRLGERYPATPASEVKLRCEKVKEAIEKLVVKNYVAGAAFQFSYGASIYFPWAVLAPKYGNLSFPKETKWLDFLTKYHEVTRRPGQSVPGGLDQIPKPGRASVPTNKGRNGKVESMRNPPAEEFVSPEVRPTNGAQPPARPMRVPAKKSRERKSPATKSRATKKR